MLRLELIYISKEGIWGPLVLTEISFQVYGTYK